MGIRVHKVLGYGFKHCKFNKDIRFNEWVFNNNEPENIKELLIQEYSRQKNLGNKDFDDCYDLQWLTNTGWFKDFKAPQSLNCYDFLKYSQFSSEKGRGPIIFTSPLNKDWYRYDDIIDYYDCDEQKDSVKMLRDGIYPRNASYIDRRTGKIVKTGYCGSLEIYKSCHNYLDDDIKTKYNVKSYSEFCVNIVPVIPSLIVNFCNIFKVFKNPMTVYRLKPMILTYWC